MTMRLTDDIDLHGADEGAKESCADIVENDDRQLTSAGNAITIDIDATGVDAMTEDPRLEQIFALIRAVVADADKRAEERLVARITGTPGTSRSSQPQLFEDSSPDKRAPRGSAAIIIDRALTEAGDKGLTVLGIQAKAETDYEKMVTTSAIRNWLKENERKRPQRYRQIGGVWFLAGRGPAMKVVGDR